MSARLDALASWHATGWRDLRVVVLGLGPAGFAVADTLAELGARCLVVAAAPDAADRERTAILDVLDVPVVVLDPDAEPGVPPEVDAHEPQLAVLATGFDPDHPLALALERREVEVWGDVELAWRLRDKVEDAGWVAVTAGRGAAAVSALAAELLRGAGRRVAHVGPAAAPILDAVRYPEGFDVLVVELAPEQLHRMPLDGPGAVHPLASVCVDDAAPLGGREPLAGARRRVYANTRLACVYNKDDEATMRMVEDADVEEGCRAIGFGLGVPGPSDLGVVEGIVVDRAFHEDRWSSALELTTLEELRLVGIRTQPEVAHALAAAALARAAGAGTGDIHDALARHAPGVAGSRPTAGEDGGRDDHEPPTGSDAGGPDESGGPAADPLG